MIDPRRVTVLGIGYGALALATLGFIGDGAVPPAPIFGGITILLPKYQPPRKAPRRPIEEDEALLLAVLH